MQMTPPSRAQHDNSPLLFLMIRLHKPVTDWLETLPPHYIRTEYVREIRIGHN